MSQKISLEVSSELAQKLEPLKPYWSQILALGLQHWSVATPPTSLRQQVENLWDSLGLTVPLEDDLFDAFVSEPETGEFVPFEVGGQPASEIIIQERR